MEVIASAYNWEEGDFKYINSDHSTILGWCLNPKSESTLLRFETFPLICYIELPSQTIKGRSINWTESKANSVYQYLSFVLGDHKPFAQSFVWKKKLYYYQAEKTYPFLFLMFNSKEALRHCKNLIKKPRDIRDIGILQLIMREDDISMTRKMLTTRNCSYSQWFKITGTLVKDEDKISTLTEEYLVDFRTLVPLEDSKELSAKPNVFSFDIETYSDDHNIFPVPSNLAHEITDISCIFQRLGSPETRKNYHIVFGDCHDIPGATVIRVSSEIELIEEFTELLEILDPDVMAGYNIFGFDYEYLNTRLSLLRKKIWKSLRYRGSRLLAKEITIKNSNWSSSGRGYNDNNILQIPGRISIDMLPVIKQDHTLPKYDLNTVSKHFLGKSKHDMKAKQMFCAHEDIKLAMALREYLESNKVENKLREEIEQIIEEAIKKKTKVAEYCVQDSYLVLEIMEKLNIWVGLVELSNIVGVTIMDIFARGQQIRVYSQI